MQREASGEAGEWLQRAQRDLLIAERALQGTPTLPDQAAFHAQQATEKALKAFLAADNQPLQKTHNLELLVTHCQAIDARFGDFLGSVRTLNPYATLFRYPGGPLEPSVDEAERAIHLARELVDFAGTRCRDLEEP